MIYHINRNAFIFRNLANADAVNITSHFIGNINNKDGVLFNDEVIKNIYNIGGFMYIYYILFVDEKRLDYLEVEEGTSEEELKNMLEGIDEKIEVYKNCCNYGPFDLLFKN